ncbi:hypothetical protein FKP32DRAFT_1677727 [Trametes sanguinea]|nr:hypothetical protein FKP32DRAFT_1677727 [Trametes sanguinea]
MALHYGLPSRLYNALVGALRGQAAGTWMKVDFTVFLEALHEIGFRQDDVRTTDVLVVLRVPPELVHNDKRLLQIARPTTSTEWPATEQNVVARTLQDDFSITASTFIEFNGALAYGAAIFVSPDA